MFLFVLRMLVAPPTKTRWNSTVAYWWDRISAFSAPWATYSVTHFSLGLCDALFLLDRMLRLNLTRRRHKTWSCLVICLFKGPPDRSCLWHQHGNQRIAREKIQNYILHKLICLRLEWCSWHSAETLASLPAKSKWNCRGCQLQKWHCWNNVCGRTARGYSTSNLNQVWLGAIELPWDQVCDVFNIVSCTNPPAP